MSVRSLCGWGTALAVALAIVPVRADSAEPPALWASTVRAWMEKGDYESASRWLEEYLKKSADPDVAYAYLYCLYQNGDYGGLLRAVGRKGFATATSDRRGRILVGLALWRDKDYSSAFLSWASILASDPHDELAWECVRVGILSAPRQQRTVLIEGLLKLLRQQQFAFAYLNGLLGSIRGEAEGAEKHFDEAHRLFPENRSVMFALRDLYRHAGNKENALRVDDFLAGGKATPEGTSETGANGDKVNKINIISVGSQGTGPATASYRLPWPAGRPIFCGSHAGRRETPHADRGRYALDFLLPQGMPVVAARAGVVYAVNDPNEVFGNHEFVTCVIIDHGDGTFGRYYHLAGGRTPVKPGQRVARGQILGQSGRTGRCQTRQLHFEVARTAKWRLSGPKVYDRWETIPVDFEETRQLATDEMPGRWLVSMNSAR